MPEVIEGPLAKHLREISEGKKPMPQTPARRHHFVPSFVLAKFATPSKRDGLLYRLDTRSGQPQKTTPNESCFVEELYTQDDEGTPNRVLEAFFSIVENYAAKAFERFLGDPMHLTIENRQTLAYYLAFQYQRTPVVIQHSAAGQEAMMAVMMGLQFANPDAFRKKYRETFQEDASEEKIETFRLKVIDMLKSGDIALDQPELAAFHMMMKTADVLASSIASLSWLLIEAKGGELITSDRALAMHDPTPKFPWSGHALKSSLKAETTFPLTPKFMLCLAQLNQPVITVDADAKEVSQLNLRTYGWASQFIYGRTQELVQKIRNEAKKKPHLVIHPRTPKQVILEEVDPEDPTVGKEHAEKGWPRGVWATGEDGRDRFCAYQLVDPKDRSSVREAISAEEATQRAYAAKRRKY